MPFSAVAKLIQSPLLWSGIEQVPPGMREELVQRYPWRIEAQVYGSRLAEVMPDGGRLPEIFGIHEVDHQRTVLWMENVRQIRGAGWSEETFTQAARWLGRLAGSAAVQANGPELDVARGADRLRYFVQGVGTLVFIPSLQGEELWQVPAIAAASTPMVMNGLRALAVRAGQLAEEMIALPQLPCHGDASPQNFLLESNQHGRGGTRFAVIDWGQYGAACPGFDLSQLLSGLVNEGEMPAGSLYRLEPLCVAAYCEGLGESGTGLAESMVRRGHALSMALFTGLTAANSPRLQEPDSQELRTFMAGRLVMAQFVVELLAATD